MVIIRTVVMLIIAMLSITGCQTMSYLVVGGAANVSSAITSKKIRMTYEESQALPANGEIVFSTDAKTVDLRGTRMMMIYYKAENKSKVVNNNIYVVITQFPDAKTNILHFGLPAYKGYYVDKVSYDGDFSFFFDGDPYVNNSYSKWDCQQGSNSGSIKEKLCVDYVNSDNITVKVYLSAVFPPRPPEQRRIVQ